MNATFPAPTAEVPVPEADHIFIGRDFYALSGNLPDGTPFQWGINLASLNRTETIAQAKLVADTFQGERAHLTANVNLDALEIGNEPDFYADGKKLGAAWTPANYSHTWLDYAQGVSEVIQLGGDGPYLTPGAMAGFETPVWTPEAFSRLEFWATTTSELLLSSSTNTSTRVLSGTVTLYPLWAG